MSRGPSGRIVVEIDPHVKARLYERLEADGATFKTWLLVQIDRFLEAPDEPHRPMPVERPNMKQEHP